MKKVFTNSMVAHVWAQQSQEEGRNSGGSIFFCNNTIYSYGDHFPMASFETNAKEETCIAVSTKSYSITTSQHQSLVRQAIPLHYKENNKVFYVPSLKKVWGENRLDHEANIKGFKEDQKQLARKITRARSAKAYLLDELRGDIANANNYCEFFDIKETFALPDAAYLASIKSELKEEAKQAKQKKIEMLRQAKIDARRYVKEFMRKETSCGYFQGLTMKAKRELPCILLRLNKDLIQSSQGAEMPVKFAKSIWQMVKHCKSEKVSFTPNGKTLQAGHFQIDSIAPNGDLKAGCHFIKYGMVKSIARQLNLLEA